jgi:hypothetical protein
MVKEFVQNCWGCSAGRVMLAAVALSAGVGATCQVDFRVKGSRVKTVQGWVGKGTTPWEVGGGEDGHTWQWGFICLVAFRVNRSRVKCMRGCVWPIGVGAAAVALMAVISAEVVSKAGWVGQVAVGRWL